MKNLPETNVIQNCDPTCNIKDVIYTNDKNFDLGRFTLFPVTSDVGVTIDIMHKIAIIAIIWAGCVVLASTLN